MSDGPERRVTTEPNQHRQRSTNIGNGGPYPMPAPACVQGAGPTPTAGNTVVVGGGDHVVMGWRRRARSILVQYTVPSTPVHTSCTHHNTADTITMCNGNAGNG